MNQYFLGSKEFKNIIYSKLSLHQLVNLLNKSDKFICNSAIKSQTNEDIAISTLTVSSIEQGWGKWEYNNGWSLKKEEEINNWKTLRRY